MIPRVFEDVLFLGLLIFVALPSSLAQNKLKDLKNVVTDCTVVVRDLQLSACDPADPAACAADISACDPVDPAACATASATTCAAITGSNGLPGLCRWDAYAAFLDPAKGCVCPADAGTCSMGEGRSGCYWHVDKENDLASTCVTNANRFHNILYYHLMKRGKKNFAINIKYGATPARGVLPQGPWGPAKIGFGDPEMQLYRARLRQQQQRVNHPLSNHGGLSSFGPQQSPLGQQSLFQTYHSHFGQQTPLFHSSHSHFGPTPFRPPHSQFQSPYPPFGPPQLSFGAQSHSQFQPPPHHFGPPTFGPQPAGGPPSQVEASGQPPLSGGPPPPPAGDGPQEEAGGPPLAGSPPPLAGSPPPLAGSPPPLAGGPPPQTGRDPNSFSFFHMGSTPIDPSGFGPPNLAGWGR